MRGPRNVGRAKLDNPFEVIASVVDRMRKRRAIVPLSFVFDAQKVDPKPKRAIPYGKELYLDVVINELYLSETGRWFVEYSPMVFSAVGMQYGGSDSLVPFVVGPRQLLKGLPANKLPPFLLIRDT